MTTESSQDLPKENISSPESTQENLNVSENKPVSPTEDTSTANNNSKDMETNPSDDTGDDSQNRILKQLTDAHSEVDHVKDQLSRTLADLENLRKRSLKEKVELRQTAAAHVMEDILPALDNMRMGIASAKKIKEAKGITDGFTMVYDQLKKALGNHGLEEVNPAGIAFDANIHECVARNPHPEIPEGQIIEVVRPGYLLNGKLIRAATVLVSAGKES